MPVFEGLLPEPHNKIVLDLLFSLAEWHAYAKLRQHTDATLNSFEKSTTALGNAIRKWAQKTCSLFETKELPTEHAARGRRTAAAEVKKAGAASSTKTKKKTKKMPAVPRKTPQGAKLKYFNFQTYKLHALGDYPRTIRRFGTTDSYSTQTVRFPAYYL